MNICPKCKSEKIEKLSDGTIICKAEHCMSISPREPTQEQLEEAKINDKAIELLQNE